MLIRSIRAENFMRFSLLEVANLPKSGLIGIEGPNESGKSTLGEILLFAFFGKTRLAVESPVSSLIRWGAESMSVEVEFSIGPSPPPDGRPRDDGAADPAGEFFIFRQIDRYGTNYVKVLELPVRTEVAAGNLQVAEFIARRVRFDFHEFQQSFYHDQYETRRLQATQVAFFEAASGIKQMREAAEGLQREIEPMEREFCYYQKEIARNLAQMEKHGRNADKLPDLGARLEAIREPLEGASRRVEECKRRVEDLRSEAALLEERAKRTDKLLELSLDALPDETERLLCEDSSACQRRKVLLEEESFRSGLHSVRASLEKLRDFAREVAELGRTIKDERQALEAQLAESAADGPAGAERAHQEITVLLRQRARRRKRQALACFLIALITGSFSFLSFQGRLSAVTFPEGWLPWIPWVCLGTGIFTLAASFFILWRAGELKSETLRSEETGEKLTREVGELRAAGSSLGALLQLSAAKEVFRWAAAAESSGHRQVAQKAHGLRQRHPSFVEEGNEQGLKAFVSNLSKCDRDLRSRVLAQVPKIEKLVHDDEAALKKLQGEKDRTESEIRECQSQASKKEALEEKNHELEPTISDIRTEIDLRLLACRLLEETAASVRAKLGPTLTRFVKSILPRLTSGRYRDVRVEDDLEIKVFSSDKNDFLSIHELSGGTNEALCLALRLAVSQAFVEARTRQAQFVFLDEPFKMMDYERAAETLKILPELSADLRQFFVIQPDFSEDERKLFDFLIRTSREETELSAEFRLDDGARAPLIPT